MFVWLAIQLNLATRLRILMLVCKRSASRDGMAWEGRLRFRLRLRGRGRGRLGSDESQNSGGDEDINKRDLKKEKPAEPHELIVTKTRQRPAHPHEHKNEHGDFGEEGCDVEQPADYAAPAWRISIDKHPVKSAMPRRKWQMPAAEKQSHDNS